MADFGRRSALKDARENHALTKSMKAATDASVISASADFWNPETADYFRKIAGTRIKGIDETTLEEIRKTLSEAYKNGEEFPKWIGRIEAVVDCTRPAGRAEMIARTELAFAYSEGLFKTYRELGVENVRWLAVIDYRTCERCAERHEQVFALDAITGTLPMHPRCRCTIISA